MDITQALESMAQSIVQSVKKMIDGASYDRSSVGRIVSIEGHNYTVEAFGGRYVVYCPQLLTLNQSVVVTAPQNNFNKLYITPDVPYSSSTATVVGQSAYEIAVANGFVGSKTAWLESLKGAAGATGPAGVGMFSLEGDSEGNLYACFADDNTPPTFNVDQNGDVYYVIEV